MSSNLNINSDDKIIRSQKCVTVLMSTSASVCVCVARPFLTRDSRTRMYTHTVYYITIDSASERNTVQTITRDNLAFSLKYLRLENSHRRSCDTTMKAGTV